MAFARLGEVELFYTDEGGSGPPILFVHGFSCDSHDWSWQLPHFARTHRVIAVDLRGHGRSSAPEGGYEPKTFANDIVALLKQLECGPVVAVGHSLGGVIVSALAVEHPDLVRAVVSVDPGYLISDDGAMAMGSILEALKADPVGTSQALLSRSYSPASPPFLKVWHMRRIAGVPGHVLVQTLSNLSSLAGRSVSAPYLRRRACPVLAVYANDERVGVEAGLFADPRSRAFCWPGSGHWLHQERPAEFNTVVEAWLTEIGAA
jgi:pimeloyl-ACP methyl ester carboxylesterase